MAAKITEACSACCTVCGAAFGYIRVTKRRLTCSPRCARRRLQQKQNERRQIAIAMTRTIDALEEVFFGGA